MHSLALTKTLAEAALAVIALAGTIAASPLLVSKARLVRERDAALKEANALRDVVGAFQVSLTAIDRLRAEVLEMRAVQIISMRWQAGARHPANVAAWGCRM